jgi:hypothetical protein
MCPYRIVLRIVVNDSYRNGRGNILYWATTDCELYPFLWFYLNIFLATFLHNQPTSSFSITLASTWTWFNHNEDQGQHIPSKHWSQLMIIQSIKIQKSVTLKTEAACSSKTSICLKNMLDLQLVYPSLQEPFPPRVHTHKPSFKYKLYKMIDWNENEHQTC